MISAQEKTAQILSKGTEHTIRLGQQLGARLKAGDVLCLEGELGAGKTHLAQGLARGWGIVERVTSPTFTLLNEYQHPANNQRFFHLDCYRLTAVEEAWQLGLDDVLAAPGVLVVEWAQRIAAALPSARLWVKIEIAGENNRHIQVTATGQRYVELLAAVVESESQHAVGD